MAKAFYSTPELAELLGVFHSTVRRWIERDQIKGFRVGRNYKIPAAEVTRMLEGHGLPVPELLTPKREKQTHLSPSMLVQKEMTGSILQRLTIVDDIDEPALVFRGDTILGTNQLFSKLVGYGQIDLIGVRLREVFSGVNGNGEERPSLVPFFAEHIQKGAVRIKTSDGQYRAFRMRMENIDGIRDAHLMVVTVEE